MTERLQLANNFNGKTARAGSDYGIKSTSTKAKHLRRKRGEPRNCTMSTRCHKACRLQIMGLKQGDTHTIINPTMIEHAKEDNGIEHEYIQAYNKNGIDPNGKDPNGKDVNESNEKSEWIE